ncbi:MAG: hypothetical protein ACI9RU_000152 [Litorivivens sp.]|jgi:hypothetical protein
MRLLWIVICLIPLMTSGQLTPSDSTLVDTLSNETKFHSPRKAGVYSALVPGLGQAYNKKYWKIPVVYAALGVTTYYMVNNNQEFKFYKKNLIAELDEDPTTINETTFNSAQLDQLQNTYRRWRDLSVIILGLGYVLNIVDANVDGHLYHFDVNDDLSLKIDPYLYRRQELFSGLTLSMNF